VSLSQTILDVFAKLRKLLTSSYLSVCLSVHPSFRMEQLGSRWADFHEILQLDIFSKICLKIQTSLKSEKVTRTLREYQFTF